MRYRSKSQLLESIRTEHDGFLTVARSIPETRYLEPGVWGDAWTIKDLFAHLTEWEQMFLGWYRQGLRGEDPALPAPGYKWNQTPELNRAIWRKHKDKPWRRVREEFEKSYTEILSLAEGLSEAQLLTPGRFRWTRKHPLASYLAPNSCSHYRTATKILKRLLRRRRATGQGSAADAPAQPRTGRPCTHARRSRIGALRSPGRCSTSARHSRPDSQAKGLVQPKRRRSTDPLQIIPGVGPSIARDLRSLGIRRVTQLRGRNPERLYERINRIRGARQDRCLLYVFRCAVYFASTERPRPRLLKWWNWSGDDPD